MAEEAINKDYDESFEVLFEKLVARAREKRAEEEAAAAQEESEQQPMLSREERLGPGGLDPLEARPPTQPPAANLRWQPRRGDKSAQLVAITGCELQRCSWPWLKAAARASQPAAACAKAAQGSVRPTRMAGVRVAAA